MATENIKGILKVHGELQIEFSSAKEDIIQFSSAKKDNKDISRRFLEELWNQKNEAIIDELIADTYIDHTAPCDPSSDELQGPEVFKEDVFRTLQNFFFDIHVSIENQTAEDDRVVNLVTWQFTLKSGNNPPTASDVVTATGISIDRVDDGKIVESWNTFDVIYRLLDHLELPCPLPPGTVPGLVTCNPTKPCPRGYICLSGKCRRV